MKHFNYYLSLIITGIIITSCSGDRPGLTNDATRYYGEPHRPQFHFSPDSMWMNDPNGMVYYEGEYHLFYQHYPYDNVWGPMHWGHAISTDLVHWEHMPIALYPDSLGLIFSGSAVIDRDNTSGLGINGQPPMIAIFTHHHMEKEKTGDNNFQYQSVAFSNDKGRSWTKYEGNPVIENPGIRDFRDPKVFWNREIGKWNMVFAANDRVRFYSSPNLTDWTFESEFGQNTGAHGGVWECPDLFPMNINGEEKWVLLVSINPGGPNGGSATQYFVGDFNGHRFTNENPSTDPCWIDYGKDNYAGVTWSDIPESDGRRLFLGWMSNWQYATRVPTERWRSAMTIPRELALVRHGAYHKLISNPVAELQVLRKNSLELQSMVLSGENRLDGLDQFNSSMYELDLVFKPSNYSHSGIASEFGIILSNESGQQIIAGYHPGDGEVFIDRTHSGNIGFSDQFPGIHKAPYTLADSDEFRIHALIDKSSIELFVDNGQLVMTEIFFPDKPFNQITLYAKNGSVKLNSGIIYSLKGIW